MDGAATRGEIGERGRSRGPGFPPQPKKGPAPASKGADNQGGVFCDYDFPGLCGDEGYLISSDSGAPSFAVINGRLPLLGEHFSTYGTSGLIPFDGGTVSTNNGMHSVVVEPPTGQQFYRLFHQ